MAESAQTSLDEAHVSDESRPPPYDHCEQGQTAHHPCAACATQYLCSRCLQFHDNPAACPVPDSLRTQSAGRGSQDLGQMMEDVLRKVSEQQIRLKAERRATRQDIHVRYNTLLYYAGKARDESLASLNHVTQNLSDALVETASLAQEVLSKTKEETSERHPGSWTDEASVLTEFTRCRFEKMLKTDDEVLWKYNTDDSSKAVLLQCLADFMSSVVAAGPDPRNGSDVDRTAPGHAYGEQHSGSVQQTGTSTPGNTDLSDSTSSTTAQLMLELRDLSARYTQMQNVTADLHAHNTLLCRSLLAVQDKNAQTSSDFIDVQKEVASLRDNLTAQRHELASLKDTASLLSQENQNLRNDVKSLQTEHLKLQLDNDQLQTDCSQLKADLTALRADHDQVEARQTQVQGDMDQLQNKLQTDQASLTSHVQTLKARVGHLEDLWEKDKPAIAALETRLMRVNEHVAFHAMLTDNVTATHPQTIVCDYVITNVGGGYSSQTGVFTAPVSGTYCFLASSTAGSDDREDADEAALDIVMEEKDASYLSAWGRGRATAHCALHVQAGQTVSLRSNHEWSTEVTFWCGSLTSFTGMLLQPDL